MMFVCTRQQDQSWSGLVFDEQDGRGGDGCMSAYPYISDITHPKPNMKPSIPVKLSFDGRASVALLRRCFDQSKPDNMS